MGELCAFPTLGKFAYTAQLSRHEAPDIVLIIFAEEHHIPAESRDVRRQPHGFGSSYKKLDTHLQPAGDLHRLVSPWKILSPSPSIVYVSAYLAGEHIVEKLFYRYVLFLHTILYPIKEAHNSLSTKNL